MGREIRRVPPDWQHPTVRDQIGNDYRHTRQDPDAFHPLYDSDYPTAAAEWKAALAKWEAGDDPDREAYRHEDGTAYEYWDWNGAPPNRAYYRTRSWTPEEATAYQVYETVTEGTPKSPVFQTADALHAWLMNEQGLSAAAADQFIAGGYVPSGIINTRTGDIKMNFETLEL